MDRKEVKTLAITAAKARLLAVEAVHRCASGHPGGSLSVLDVLTVLYFHTMRVDPQNPADPDRDRFVLSKGHCTPALYATLALRGYYAVEELELFRSIKGHMSGHPDMVNVKGVDMSTGSPPWVWPLPASWMGRTTVCTPLWATARSKRARCGRLPWLRPSTSWTTCAL